MSTDDNTLATDIRTKFGKGASRRLRAEGKIPAVLYGHGSEPKHLSLPGHDLYLLVRKANAVLDLTIEGESQLALVKDVQRNPVLQGVPAIEHVDLVIVRRGEKVQVDVPVHLEGESDAGTIPNHESTSLQIEVEALHIPESITVSIEGLEEGAQILAGDVALPGNATLLTDAEQLVVGIVVPAAPVLEDPDAEPAEGEAGEGAEGEEGEGGDEAADSEDGDSAAKGSDDE